MALWNLPRSTLYSRGDPRQEVGNLNPKKSTPGPRSCAAKGSGGRSFARKNRMDHKTLHARKSMPRMRGDCPRCRAFINPAGEDQASAEAVHAMTPQRHKTNASSLMNGRE
jgi:hypothetical protein